MLSNLDKAREKIENQSEKLKQNVETVSGDKPSREDYDKQKDGLFVNLEKVGKEKRLELHFTSTKNCRIILCKNSVSASILDSNGDLHTTKTDSEFHGLGHIIVEDIVQKYGGFTDYFEENGMFGVQVSIPINNE